MEIVDKFDKKRQPLNKTTERYDYIDGEYKQSMHVWIVNDEGKFLFQKRTENKKSFPKGKHKLRNAVETYRPDLLEWFDQGAHKSDTDTKATLEVFYEMARRAKNKEKASPEQEKIVSTKDTVPILEDPEIEFS